MFPSVQDKLFRQLLTAKTVLIVYAKHLEDELEWAIRNNLDDLATQLQEAKIFFADYKTCVNFNICELKTKTQLLNNVEDLLDRCRELHDNTMGDALSDPVKDRPFETELKPKDSVPQVASCQGAMSAMPLNSWHVRLI